MSDLSNRELLRRGRLRALAKRGPPPIEDLRSALEDPDWHVRRNALRVLDHIPNAGCAGEVVELLDDPHTEVRKWAAHTLGCDRCKPDDDGSTDPVPDLIRVALQDPAADVRRAAVLCLAWSRPVDQRIAEFLGTLRTSATDPCVQRHAEDGFARHTALARRAAGP